MWIHYVDKTASLRIGFPTNLGSYRWPGTHICLESDAQGMINSVLNRGVDLSPFGCLVEDYQLLLRAACFVYVVHGFREVNCVADRLAHYALLMRSNGGTPPLFGSLIRLSKILAEV
ncbi:unnamed protein product [Prunus armeniaca]|nr:unnamed protein product [Prunus armeniaca]